MIEPEHRPPTFEVVALAASAGGLSALSEVLAPLPVDFRAAIVLVQHLDPNHKSLMAEILGRRTAWTSARPPTATGSPRAASGSPRRPTICSSTATARSR